MHTKIRTSAIKHTRQVSFTRRKKTRGGKATIARQRKVAAGKPKPNKVAKLRHSRDKKKRFAAKK